MKIFRKIIDGCVSFMQKYLPEPFIFAIILTFVAILVAMPVCKQSIVEVVSNWGGGVWNLLGFSMQMALVLVTGATLAAAPSIKKGINKLASLPKTPAGAIALVTGISAVACWLNWGFGLIVGAIFAKEIAKKLRGVDYRLLIASAYSGFVVWHAGISGSIPLKMASDVNELAKDTNGVITSAIPIGNTILDWHNIIMVVLVTIALVAINSAMHPKTGIVTIDPALLQEDDDPVGANHHSPNHSPNHAPVSTPAMKLENSRILSALLALLGLSFLIISLFIKGKSFDLGSVILLFLFLGIILHKTPIAYVRSFAKSVSGAAGILLQFPFYAGIMGIITGVGESGICLGTVVSEAFVNISTSTTYPIYTFLCAAILNMFVPSGGGHWAIQAPIMFAAGEALNVDHGLTGMAIAWGDAWTNLIQPFWALPALAIAKLNAKDIMGFCLIDLVVSGIIIIGGLLIWAI